MVAAAAAVMKARATMQLRPATCVAAEIMDAVEAVLRLDAPNEDERFAAAAGTAAAEILKAARSDADIVSAAVAMSRKALSLDGIKRDVVMRLGAAVMSAKVEL